MWNLKFEIYDSHVVLVCANLNNEANWLLIYVYMEGNLLENLGLKELKENKLEIKRFYTMIS